MSAADDAAHAELVELIKDESRGDRLVFATVKDGEWEVVAYFERHKVPGVGGLTWRGTGRTFEQAWHTLAIYRGTPNEAIDEPNRRLRVIQGGRAE